jgi:hypothetical protein
MCTIFITCFLNSTRLLWVSKNPMKEREGKKFQAYLHMHTSETFDKRSMAFI